MNPKLHGRLTQIFLVVNSVSWLPWGVVNLIWPRSWAGEIIPGINVYVLSSAVARTEVCMAVCRSQLGPLFSSERSGPNIEIPYFCFSFSLFLASQLAVWGE
jgi:hypothetical protein